MPDLWDVWRVHYAYYEDIALEGDKPQERVKRNLTFNAAAREVEERGFGYCMKPAER